MGVRGLRLAPSRGYRVHCASPEAGWLTCINSQSKIGCAPGLSYDGPPPGGVGGWPDTSGSRW